MYITRAGFEYLFFFHLHIALLNHSAADRVQLVETRPIGNLTLWLRLRPKQLTVCNVCLANIQIFKKLHFMRSRGVKVALRCTNNCLLGRGIGTYKLTDLLTYLLHFRKRQTVCQNNSINSKFIIPWFIIYYELFPDQACCSIHFFQMYSVMLGTRNFQRKAESLMTELFGLWLNRKQQASYK